MIDLVSRYALQWRGDLVMAIESMTQGTLPPDGILSREMIAFYISIFIISMMALKSGRSLLYKIFDTCVALVLLGVTGAIVLGIPFAITYLSFRGVWFVGVSLYSFLVNKV